MLFNIYISDMFFALNEIEICNFADDTTPYVFDSKHLISGNKNKYISAKLDQEIVWESNDVELLGVAVDNNLRFDKHVSNICLKVKRKLSALTRAAKIVPFKQDVFFSKHL